MNSADPVVEAWTERLTLASSYDNLATVKVRPADLASALATVAQQAAEIERLRGGKCSCMEVFGEDPRCIKHGQGTAWAKANPDICDLIGRATTAEARVREAVEVVKPFAAMWEETVKWDLHREDDRHAWGAQRRRPDVGGIPPSRRLPRVRRGRGMTSSDSADLPHAIWSGTFKMGAVDMIVHVLNDGRRIIDENSMEAFFGSDSGATADELAGFAAFMRTCGPSPTETEK